MRMAKTLTKRTEEKCGKNDEIMEQLIKSIREFCLFLRITLPMECNEKTSSLKDSDPKNNQKAGVNFVTIEISVCLHFAP